MRKSVVVMVVGLVLIILAAAYFLTPANSLPSFLPGYDASVAKIHYKHGVVVGQFELRSDLLAVSALASMSVHVTRHTDRRTGGADSSRRRQVAKD